MSDESTELSNALKTLLNQVSTEEDDTKTQPVEAKEETKNKIIGDNELSVNMSGESVNKTFGVSWTDTRQMKCKIYKKEDWPEFLHEFIPEPDPHFVWHKEILIGLTISQQLNKIIKFTGPPGSSKTSSISQFCAITKQPMIRIPGMSQTESAQHFGFPWLEKDKMDYRDGPATLAVKHGAWLLLDEFFKNPPGVNMMYQWLFEPNGKIWLMDKPGEMKDQFIYPKDTFRIAITDNVKGFGDELHRYAATNIQDSSTLDRIQINIETKYLDKKQEIGLLKNKFPILTEEFLDKVIKLAHLVRDGYSEGALSLPMTRSLFEWLELGLITKDFKLALNYAYTSSLPDKSEEQAMEGIFKNVFGSDSNEWKI